MLRSLRNLEGMSIDAVDGEIGEVIDSYFDDIDWTVRYLVADTGTWLPGRKVLISPMAVRETAFGSRRVDVIQSREQVRNSPDIDRGRELGRARHSSGPDPRRCESPEWQPQLVQAWA